jgi:hypothetical protein
MVPDGVLWHQKRSLPNWSRLPASMPWLFHLLSVQEPDITSVTQRGHLAPPLRPNLTSRFKFSLDDLNPSIILLYSSITCCWACCMLSRRAISFCCDSCIFNAWVSSSLRTFFSSFSSWSFFRRF